MNVHLNERVLCSNCPIRHRAVCARCDEDELDLLE
ncbi:MAG: transcriptional regulator, partial [Pseudomonadota bacterium]